MLALSLSLKPLIEGALVSFRPFEKCTVFNQSAEEPLHPCERVGIFRRNESIKRAFSKRIQFSSREVESGGGDMGIAITLPGKAIAKMARHAGTSLKSTNHCAQGREQPSSRKFR